MLHARIVRFDVMATVAFFWKVFGTKHSLTARLDGENFSQKVLQYPSHRILRYVHGVLNVDKKKLITQFG